MLNFLTNGYVLPFISNPFSQSPLIHSGYKAHQRSSSALLSSLCCQEHNRKDGKCKISPVLQLPVPSSQASPRVEASDSKNQAQFLSTCKKVQMEMPESIRASLIPRDWVASIDLSDPLHSHPHPPKLKEVPDTVLGVNNIRRSPNSNLLRCFPFVGYEYRLVLALVKPTQRDSSIFRI